MKQHGLLLKTTLPIVFAILVVAAVLIAGNRQDLSTTNGVLATIKSHTEQTFSNIYVSDENEWLAEMNSGLPADVEGYDFRLNSQGVPTLSFVMGTERPDTYKKFLFFTHRPKAAQSIAEAGPEIDRVMARAGFKKSNGTQNIFFDRDETTCVFVSAPAGDSLTLSCSTPAILQVQAEAAEPFVSAYTEAIGLSPSDISIGPVLIKDESSDSHVITASKSPGYTIAEAIIVTEDAKTIALFYQKDEGSWIFVTEASDEYGFRCGEFEKDPDARKAFYDQICLGPDGHVRLDTNNRALQ